MARARGLFHAKGYGITGCDFSPELVYGVAVLSKELLDILVCPACRQELAYDPTRQTLKCSGCRRVYPIEDDIPILLVDRAKIEE